MKSPAPKSGAGLLFVCLGESVIFGLELEIGLRMGTDRANLGRAGSDMDMAAVGAFPDDDIRTFEDGTVLDVLRQLEVALLVLLFDLGHRFEESRNFGEALFPGLLGEAGIHIGPFVIFARRRVLEIVRRAADPAVEQLEPNLGMLLFVVCLLYTSPSPRDA